MGTGNWEKICTVCKICTSVAKIKQVSEERYAATGCYEKHFFRTIS